MQITSILAIYFLVWVLSAFVLLPFGIRTHDEEGVAKIPGQAESAPANFRPGRLALKASLVAAVVTGFFVANYSYGWITVDDINLFDAPPGYEDA
jgi:predicted secreted protein